MSRKNLELKFNPKAVHDNLKRQRESECKKVRKELQKPFDKLEEVSSPQPTEP